MARTNIGSLLDMDGNGLSEFAQGLDSLLRSVLEEDLPLDLLDSEASLVERDRVGDGGAGEGKSRREGGEGRHDDCTVTGNGRRLD